ncbi:MAG: DUF2254 domain-containing protein [Proteobacteria bacterium]|nr:DUF2254 domain-containing protein [Pseudomonadota bacterium]
MQMWKRLWMERRNRLWVLPALNSVIAVVVALAAAWVPELLPGMRLPVVEAKTLDNLLGVVASSMLAVTTFSLSIMVSAFASASSGVTPRATELVMGDEGTRAAIANFLSAFMFSIVAQIALGMRYYGDNGRFILFVGTCLVLAWLMLTLLRWVRTLSSLGRMGNTLARIEGAALDAMADHCAEPFMRARPGPADSRALEAAPGSVCVRADDLRALRRVDVQALQGWAAAHACTVHVRVRAGEQVGPGRLLAVVVPDTPAGAADAGAVPADAEVEKAVRAHLQFDAERTFDQDPRFGVIVLREAAQRALSAAINDPGTALACLNGIARVLLKGQQQGRTARDPQAQRHDRVTVLPLDVTDFLADGFDPIARDGAASFEVMLRMQKLLALVAAQSRDAELAADARRRAVFARDCGLQGLVQAQDRAALDALHRELFGTTG